MFALATIPSPETSTIDLGPLTVHAYGVCIAIAMLAGTWLARRRWVAAGGNADDVNTIAIWSVLAGVVGARIYHVLTDWHLYRDRPLHALEIWDGGLGIWGGVAAGAIVGVLVARRRGLSGVTMLDIAAPSIPLAQAIGRIGNYFNQELFGRPTTLPWGLEIDLTNRPHGYERFSTFHPTFLYESLWNLGLCLALLAISARLKLRAGQLFLLYVVGYTGARFFIEGLRIDDANTLGGLRFNEWTSAGIFLMGTCLLVLSARREKVEAR